KAVKFRGRRSKKSKAKCTRHSESAVVRGTAPKSNNDLFRAAPRRIQNHFADAERAGDLRIQFARPQPAHSCRFAHFHHSERLLCDPAVTRFDLAVKWAVRFAVQPGSAERVRNYFSGSFAAIGHWHDVDPGIR